MDFRKSLMLSLTALMLSACGGGGGGHDGLAEPEVVNPGLTGGPIVISHRGASGYLPEHTLAAYELAIQMGADYIEPDLQTTSDGVLVAMHDTTLDQNTNVATLFDKRNGHSNYPVSDFTLAEIKTLTVTYSDAGTAKTSYPGYTPSDASYNDFKIPTFEEVIAFAKAQSEKHGRPIGIYPEAKQNDEAMEKGILDLLAAYDMDKPDSPVFIQSFYDDTIRSLHAKQQERDTKIPQILLGVAIMEGNVAKLGLWIKDEEIEPILDLSEVKKIADGIGVCIGDSEADCLVDPEMVSPEFIKQAHEAGLRVHGWTFNKADAIAAQKEYRKYLDMGMDGMFSNYPDLAILARDEPKAENHKFTTNDPVVISHRGASGYLPEHTLAAYELAIQMGVDYIEPDLQTTSDGHLVAMHDDTLQQNTNVENLFASRQADGTYPVSDFTLAEIQTLTVDYSDANGGTDFRDGKGGIDEKTLYPGYKPSDESYKDFRVPTFRQVIEFAKAQSAKHGRPIGIYPEAKQTSDPDMEDGILAILSEYGITNSKNIPVFIQSFGAQTIKNLHDKQQVNGTQIPLILLGVPAMQNGVAKVATKVNYTTLEVEETIDLTTVAGFAQGVGMNNLSVMTSSNGYQIGMTKEWIKQAHDLKLKVHGWTFNKPNAIAAAEEYRRFLEMGIDGYFSNYPNLGVMARDRFIGPSN